MKRQTGSLLIACLYAVAPSLMAGEFNSVIITPASSPLPLIVPDKHFLRIRNFTQEGGSQRGVVTVTANGQTKNVLTAALIDQGRSPSPPPSSSDALEFINKVVVAGPATVTVAPVPNATLFITYKREAEPDPATPTPTPSPTATATPSPTATIPAVFETTVPTDDNVAATPTPTPTATPTPTSTPTPTPTPTATP